MEGGSTDGTSDGLTDSGSEGCSLSIISGTDGAKEGRDV